MRCLPIILASLLLTLAGCVATNREGTPEWLLATAPAVPIVMPDGSNATGITLPNGMVLTCSHALARGRQDGDIAISGNWLHYHTANSGDGLNFDWQSWKGDDGMARYDWALLRPSQFPESSNRVVPTSDLRLVVAPPQPGETVYLVGYTREGSLLRQYWVQLLTVTAPSGISDPESLIWLKRQAGSPLHRGFSGSPIVRVTKEGVLEVCAMFHGYYGQKERPSERGVAIPLPLFDN